MAKWKNTEKRTELKLVPRHVGIIMDGNGRWAAARGMLRYLGHRSGVNRLEEIIRISSELGIEALSLYAFSTENWNRSDQELENLFDLLVEFLTGKLGELHENDVRIIIIGDISRFPQKVVEACENAVAHTRENTGLAVGIALNYGGQTELARAAREIAAQAMSGKVALEDIDENLLAGALYTAGLPQLDCLIRTGGEKRLSNFMLYQAAYAELIFLDTFWPDFTQKEYILALKEFERRDRRFGKA